MPNLHESLGRMTSDRDDIADRYAQALEVLDGLKKGRISLENIQLTPQGWKVVVPEKPAYSTGDPSLPPAKFIGPQPVGTAPEYTAQPPPEQPPFAMPCVLADKGLAPPQTGPRPAELPGTPIPDAAPAREFVQRVNGPNQPQGQPLFHED